MRFYLHDVTGIRTLTRIAFDESFADISTLVALYDELTESRKKRPDIKYEALKRSAIFLIVTAWETFVEDTILDSFEERLNSARTAKVIKSTFEAAADSWLGSHKNRVPLPSELADWAGSGWKKILTAQARKDVNSLNTPNSDNLEHLFKKYLGVSLETAWKMPKKSFAQTRRQLDLLIMLRGRIAHISKRVFAHYRSVSRKEVTDAMKLILSLVDAIERNLGIQRTQA
ncbi:MAG: HEPN domain-containing protein [Bacteroidota bacterium]|jgi:hypothetical protein